MATPLKAVPLQPLLRRGEPDDAERCGTICYYGFKQIAEQHNFPPDFPSPEIATDLMRMLLTHPGFYPVVAEIDGDIVGSNFLDERSAIAGVGPITVDPVAQNAAVGRQLMEAVLARAAERGFPGVRLVQAAYHNRSLSLYTKLGFVAREPLSVMQGPALGLELAGFPVRQATTDDLAACNRLCVKVHGHDRGGELEEAIAQGSASVVEHDGRITGYATPVAFFGHAVAETNDSLKALIGAAPSFPGLGFLLPARNHELFAWCLARGLRVVEPMTLMSRGLYNEPAGAYLPAIFY